jgi:hypothetical protein
MSWRPSVQPGMTRLSGKEMPLPGGSWAVELLAVGGPAHVVDTHGVGGAGLVAAGAGLEHLVGEAGRGLLGVGGRCRDVGRGLLDEAFGRRCGLVGGGVGRRGNSVGGRGRGGVLVGGRGRGGVLVGGRRGGIASRRWGGSGVLLLAATGGRRGERTEHGGERERTSQGRVELHREAPGGRADNGRPQGRGP